MALYLVIHTPRKDVEEEVFPATNMADMARDHGGEDARTRWLKSWSGDLHDDRHFTLWQANSAEDIQEVMARYHFLGEAESDVVCVQEWTPSDVASAASDTDDDR